MSYKSHITVAAVIHDQDKYLLVREIANQLEVYNQPAGHWEIDETLEEAAIRETLEETGWEFEPEAVVAIYRWKHPRKDEVYLRITFCGRATKQHKDRPLDEGILEALWMTREQLAALPEIALRSKMVLQSIADFERGKRFDLDLLSDVVESW